jgi:Zn-dependent protease with chaperone function
MIAAAAAVVIAVWATTGARLEHHAPPELVAVLRLLTLLSAAVLPIALAVCLGAVLRAHAHAGCHLGYPTSRLLGAAFYALAVLLTLRIVMAAVTRAHALRKAVPRGLGGSRRLRLGRHELLVLPTAEPIAYTAGLTRTRVVVSRGLLMELDGDERQALLAHELAHAQAGHPRLLFVGDVVVDALGFLPPVRRAFASLRREIEFAADAAAVSECRERGVLARAIARCALASSPVGVAAISNDHDVRERLQRLLEPPRSSPLATTGVVSAVAVIASALVASACLATHAGRAPIDVAACLSVLAVLGLPPLLRFRARLGRAGSTTIL